MEKTIIKFSELAEILSEMPRKIRDSEQGDDISNTLNSYIRDEYEEFIKIKKESPPKYKPISDIFRFPIYTFTISDLDIKIDDKKKFWSFEMVKVEKMTDPEKKDAFKPLNILINFNDCDICADTDNTSSSWILSIESNQFLLFHGCDFYQLKLTIIMKPAPDQRIVMVENKFYNSPLKIMGFTGSDYRRIDKEKNLIYKTEEYYYQREEVRKRIEDEDNPDLISKIFNEKYFNNHKISDGTKLINVIDFLKIIAYHIMKNKVKAENIKIPHLSIERTDTVILIDNQISKLKLEGYMHVYFRGKNTIETIICESQYTNIYWGAYQNIDPDKNNYYLHKEFFIRQKNKEFSKNDKQQQIILDREIAKCDHALIRDEKEVDDITNTKSWLLRFFAFIKKVIRTWQDQFIYTWSKQVSDYGVSWATPTLYLLVVNMVVAVYLLLVACAWNQQGGVKLCPSFIEIFRDYGMIIVFELFIPLKNLSEVIEPCQILNCQVGKFIQPSWHLSLVNVLHKIIYAGLVYETIRSFRRHSKK